MSRIIATLALLGAFSFVGVAASTPPLAPQTSNQAAVTLKVTPINIRGDAWEFELVFDTHSQDLKDDLLKTTVLVAPDGKQFAPTEWQGDPPSGHHRQGVLRFNEVKPQPDNFELRVARPGEAAPRVFKWSRK